MTIWKKKWIYKVGWGVQPTSSTIVKTIQTRIVHHCSAFLYRLMVWENYFQHYRNISLTEQDCWKLYRHKKIKCTYSIKHAQQGWHFAISTNTNKSCDHPVEVTFPQKVVPSIQVYSKRQSAKQLIMLLAYNSTRLILYLWRVYQNPSGTISTTHCTDLAKPIYFSLSSNI